MSDAIKRVTDDIFFFQEDSALVHCACNTVLLLQCSLDFLFPEPCPPTAPSWTYWLQDLGSHTAAWVWVLSQKTEEIKEQRVEFWQCTDTTFEWKKCDFRVSPFFQVGLVKKNKLFGGGIVKRLLIVYFIGNISAKKNIKMRSRILTW